MTGAARISRSSSHALQSLTVTPLERQSKSAATASWRTRLETALGKKRPTARARTASACAVVAKYVEAGADKSATGSYVISYRWEGGGLFGGRSLVRLVTRG